MLPNLNVEYMCPSIEWTRLDINHYFVPSFQRKYCIKYLNTCYNTYRHHNAGTMALCFSLSLKVRHTPHMGTPTHNALFFFVHSYITLTLITSTSLEYKATLSSKFSSDTISMASQLDI